MKRPFHRTSTAALFSLCALVVLCAACQVDAEKFQQRLFSCNPSATDPACGTDLEGQPMVCVGAQQLGGPNFCSVSCDRAVVPVDGNAQVACLPAGPLATHRLSGAALKKCNPSVPDSCGNPQLTCLRTDMLSPEGVCMTISTCQKNTDCRDPVRSVCMGELLKTTYPSAPLVTDHTYCLQTRCRSDGTSCSPGEVCLRSVVVKESKPSDICVPNCDSNGNCPPNYFCYQRLYSQSSPNVCIPGLMGLRCETNMDCLFGTCADTGAGFRMCTVGCQDDTDCAKFDGEQGTFFCNPQKVCAGGRAFRGAVCDVDAECHPGEYCGHFSTTQPGGRGLCLLPCTDFTSCPAYGGVNHMCLPQMAKYAAAGAPNVCWPGELGIPCVADSNCAGGLTCKPIPNSLAGVCSTVCVDDADCLRNRFTKDGYCEPNAHVCLSPLKANQVCERDQQCDSKRCVSTKFDGAGKATESRCAEIPGY